PSGHCTQCPNGTIALRWRHLIPHQSMKCQHNLIMLFTLDNFEDYVDEAILGNEFPRRSAMYNELDNV
ncbi:MAG: hypothetical protein D6737_13825, partial [Chloroflexi bacterium]